MSNSWNIKSCCPLNFIDHHNIHFIDLNFIIACYLCMILISFIHQDNIFYVIFFIYSVLRSHPINSFFIRFLRSLWQYTFSLNSNALRYRYSLHFQHIILNITISHSFWASLATLHKTISQTIIAKLVTNSFCSLLNLFIYL